MDADWPEHFQPGVIQRANGYPASYVIALEAWRRGLSVEILDGRFRRYRISGDEQSLTFTWARPSLTTAAAWRLANDKFVTNQLLAARGVPVPSSWLLHQQMGPDELQKVAADVDYPAVLKPAEGAKGSGVFTNIQDPTDLLHRWEDLLRLRKVDRGVIETHHHGDDYRVLVIGDQVAGACRRVPANVVGDGVQTIAQLITQKNLPGETNPFLRTRMIRPDTETDAFLYRQQLTYDSAPAQDARIWLRGKANASAGGDVIDVTDTLPQKVKDAALNAVAAIPGLTVAGVDVIYDEQTSDTDDAHTVIEVNSTPQLGSIMYPSQGVGRDVPKMLIDYCFPESTRAEAPGDKWLAFDSRSALVPLRARAARRVELAPLPAHRLPHRRVYDLSGVVLSLDPVQKRRILRLSMLHGVSGMVYEEDGRYLLAVAGRKSKVLAFRDTVLTMLDVPVHRGRRWQDPVVIGFTLPDE